MLDGVLFLVFQAQKNTLYGKHILVDFIILADVHFLGQIHFALQKLHEDLWNKVEVVVAFRQVFQKILAWTFLHQSKSFFL